MKKQRAEKRVPNSSLLLAQLRQDLAADANPGHAIKRAASFFAVPGGIAEGDQFLGLTVPQQRTIACKFRDLSPGEIAQLLESDIHEERFIALVILIDQYQRASWEHRGVIHLFYLQRLDRVNHWDLVDVSAPVLLGDYLADRARPIIYHLARSENPWERRAAVVATLAFIRQEDLGPTFDLSEKLLADPDTYVHKACGWALREAGQVSRHVLRNFIDQHVEQMPAAMFSYATEKFPPTEKVEWKERRKKKRKKK